MIKCPRCEQPCSNSKQNEHRPFCSRRCQLLDLGAWASEDRKIAGQEIFDNLDENEETFH